MIGQFAKRPGSRHRSNLRPVTAEANEENKRQSDECFQIAKKHMIKKQYEPALKNYTNATIHNPKNYKAFCNMGKIYKEIGRFAQARSFYNKALFANANDPITLYNLANLQRITGNDDLSIFLYARVATLKQKYNADIGELYYDALINQGICYKNLQLFDEAIDCNDKAIKVRPNDECAYFNKGMCLLKKIYSLIKTNFVNVKKKLCKDSQNAFKKVLEFHPDKFAAKMALVQLIYLDQPIQKSYNQAIAQFQVLQKSAPEDQKFELSLKIRYCQNELKKIDQAKVILSPKQDIVERVPTANKYDNQTKQAQVKNAQNSKKRTANGKRQNKQQKISEQLQNLIKQGKSVRSLIDQLVDQKRFDEAFSLVQLLPNGIQKYQCQIIINYNECVDSQNEAFLQSAVSIYNDYIIKNNPDMPITKDLCSPKGHQIIANMLTVNGNYTQASKHYEVLLQLIQDKKFGKEIISEQRLKELHTQLGICYAQRGLLRQAISQYKKSYQMQPNNYFLMTNLCELLIQDKQEKQARKYYEAYLKKNGGENIENKVVYIDSLINISICVRESPEQDLAILKAIEAINKYYPTYQDIKANLYEEAILGVYLRSSEILEKKIQAAQPNSPMKKQLYQKILDKYLTCLQFQNCPDRQAICTNVGILFYLGGCYANALSFYQTVILNRKIIANNLALTFLHLQQYQVAVGCIKYAVENNPQNIIYATNFQIIKWMFGTNDKNVFPNYNCKCQTMYEARVNFGLWMLDQLTTLIDENKVKVQNSKDSEIPVDKQVQNVLKILIQHSQTSETNKNRTQAWKSKAKVLTQNFNQHVRQYHTKQQKPKSLVNNQTLDLCLKKCSDSKQFQTSLSEIMDILNGFTKNLPNYTIIQSLISIFCIVNSHIIDSTQIIRSLIAKKLIQGSRPTIQSLQTAQFKKSNGDYISKKFILNYPKVDLKFAKMQSSVRQTECMLENITYYLVQSIENIYYSQPEAILSPLNKQYRHPHCQSQSYCLRCIIESSALYSSIFGIRIGNEAKLNKNWTTKQQINAFPAALANFVQTNLVQQTNNVFIKNTNQLTIKLQQKQFPIILKTHHKTFANVIDFVKKIDSSFSLAAQNNSKGVRFIIINKSIGLQMFWGQTVTTLDRYCQWLNRRQTNFTHDAVLLLGEDLKDIEEIFEDGPESIAKIHTALYQKQ